MGHAHVDTAGAAIAAILEKYKQYERLDPDPLPSFVCGPYAMRHGMVALAHNVYAGSKVMAIAVKIGSKFAEPKEYKYPSSDGRAAAIESQRAVVRQLKDEVREVLCGLKDTNGGYIEEVYGTAHSLLGWVSK